MTERDVKWTSFNPTEVLVIAVVHGHPREVLTSTSEHSRALCAMRIISCSLEPQHLHPVKLVARHIRPDVQLRLIMKPNKPVRIRIEARTNH